MCSTWIDFVVHDFDNEWDHGFIATFSDIKGLSGLSESLWVVNEIMLSYEAQIGVLILCTRRLRYKLQGCSAF